MNTTSKSNIEILSIGNELLAGATVNTNATWISYHLLQEGWTVERVTTIPDEKQVMRQEIEAALARSKVVITTGGLGPTRDDLTLSVAAEIFNTPLVLE